MTKEDFLVEMQKLDKNTRRDVVDKSSASQELKTVAKRDTQPQIKVSAPGQPGASRKNSASPAAGASSKPQATSPGPERSSGSSGGSRPSSKEASETEVEKKRRLEALRGVPSGSRAGEEVAETAAERRRREAALGMSREPEESDSEDDDTPRVPPPKPRIRFVEGTLNR